MNSTTTRPRDDIHDRATLAAALLDGCPDEMLDDHETIAAAILDGASAEILMGLRETNDWPETYVWLRDRLADAGIA